MTDYKLVATALRKCKATFCDKCPIHDGCRSFGDNTGYAASVIDELVAENEKLVKMYVKAEIDATNSLGELLTVNAKYNALLDDVQGYQGSICCYCKNIVREKGMAPSCKEFGDFPTTDGVPLMCGKFEWRGAADGSGGECRG